MGNSPPTNSSLRLRNGDHPYRVQLGNSVALEFKGRKTGKRQDNEAIEAWKVSYTVDSSTCDVYLAKIVITHTGSTHDREEKLVLQINDLGIFAGNLSASVSKRAESGFLHPLPSQRYTMNPESTIGSNHTITTNALGGSTKTSFDLYGHGKRWDLLVREWKTKSKEEEPYTGTMAHYYANAENGKDVGLSVVVKRIRVSQDGHLDFAVDGPEQHPVDALFYMFNEVHRTGTWKPTYCLHCANNII